MELKVRRTEKDDVLLIFNWANDELTRKMSFNQDSILLEDHKRWFNKILQQPKTHLLIVELRENLKFVPIGQIKFDEDGKISHSIAKDFRGKKLGIPSLKAAMQYIKFNSELNTIFAQIKPNNIPTIKIYETYGFVFHSEITVKGNLVRKYIYEFSLSEN